MYRFTWWPWRKGLALSKAGLRHRPLALGSRLLLECCGADSTSSTSFLAQSQEFGRYILNFVPKEDSLSYFGPSIGPNMLVREAAVGIICPFRVVQPFLVEWSPETRQPDGICIARTLAQILWEISVLNQSRWWPAREGETRLISGSEDTSISIYIPLVPTEYNAHAYSGLPSLWGTHLMSPLWCWH
jgi:hypothetical protein